jgi:hypothetical protein
MQISSVQQAHALASTIEAGVCAELGAEVEVESHLDPLLPDLIQPAEPVMPECLAAVRARVEQEMACFPELTDLHRLQVRRVDGGLHIVFHCRLADDVPLWRAHETANRLEYRLYEGIAEARRILVHTEPAKRAS